MGNHENKKTGEMMSTIDIKMNLKPYEFTMIQPLLRSWFSHVGRVRHRLWRAYSADGGAKREKTLVKSLERLRHGSARNKPPVEDVIRQGLLYLAWRHLKNDDLAGACTWLTQLHEEFPDIPEKLPLRWQLVHALFGALAKDTFSSQAQQLMADPLLDPQIHGPAVLRFLNATYKQFGASICEAVVSHAHPQLANTRRIKAVRALCCCPQRFTSQDEAHSWVDKVQPTALSFSSRMKAEAWIIAARAAEWAGEWENMSQFATQAHKTLPGFQQAQYWIVRSRLHLQKSDPLGGLDGGSLPEGPESTRLRLLVALHRDPTLIHAEAALAVLSGEHGEPDVQEKELALQLLKAVLQPKEIIDKETSTKIGSLSEAVEKCVGRLSWTQLNIAVGEILVSRQYREAIGRLEQPDVRCLKPGETLLQVARILAGVPAPAAEADQRSPLACAEQAIYHIFYSDGVQQDNSDNDLLAGLDEARQNRIVNWIPELRTALDALYFAVAVVSGNLGCEAEVHAYRCEPGTPPWTQWLFARMKLWLYQASEEDKHVEGLELGEFIVAWEIEAWMANYPIAKSTTPDIAQQVEEAIVTQIRKAPDGIKTSMHTMHTCRTKKYTESKPISSKTNDIFPGLTGLYAAACEEGFAIEAAYAPARADLFIGATDPALKVFRELARSLTKMCRLTRLFWQPIIDYWYAVTLAHSGDEKAHELFQSLIDGLKGPDARSQLAMLAIRGGHLEQAAKWLEGIRADRPSILYVKSLLSERQGDATDAMALLLNDEGQAVLKAHPQSPYVRAARHLVAVIKERQGQAKEADVLYDQLLSDCPHDAIACARLGRLRIMCDYNPKGVDSTGLDPSHAQLLARGSSVAWSKGYEKLHRLLNAMEADVHKVKKALKDVLASASGPAWRVTLARKYLQFGRHENAHLLLKGGVSNEMPDILARPRIILHTWKLLSEPAMRACINRERLDSFQEAYQEMDRLLESKPDVVLQRWHDLLRCACSIGEDPAAGIPSAIFGDAAVRDPWVFWRVAGLWSTDPVERKQAGDVILSSLAEDATGWSEEQRKMLKALAAWECEMDEVFLEQYACLEPRLERLPVHERNLWAPAALIRYSRADWNSLAGDRLPECLADMSDPLVCLILELADARAAVSDLKNPSQRVAKRIKGIQNNLVALLEKLDSQTTESPTT